MSKQKFVFTKKTLLSLEAPIKGRIRVWDEKCQYLCLQVTKTGRKTFYLYRYDSSQKRPFQKSIGTFPDVTVERARDIAIKWLVEMAECRLSGKVNVPFLEDAANAYIENRRAKLSTNTLNSYYGILNHHLKDWKSVKLDEISRQNVINKFLKLSKKSKSTANRTFRFLRAIFNEQMDLVNDDMSGRINLSNPVMILSKRRYWHKESPANDWIPPEKLPHFFQTLDALRSFDEFYYLVADYFEFLIFTGLRRREASSLKIKDINFTNLTYLVRPKGKELIQMPLTAELATFLERRINVSKTLGSEYVFANPDNGGNPLNDPRRAMHFLRKELGIHITIHGFRRSFATYAESIDLSQYVIKRLLNHSMGRDVTGVHYLQRDISRLRAALSKIYNRIGMQGKQSNEISYIQFVRSYKLIDNR